MPESDPGLMTLFTTALERTDPGERAAYLDRACGGNADLRRRVEELLAAHAVAGRFLELDRTSAHDPPTPASPELTGALEPEPPHSSKAETGAHLPGKATDTFRGSPAGREHSPATELGTVIAGRYTLVDVIGEGGMGSVYLAEQTEPVRRQVALKLIKSGMDSKGVLARFDAERQALALMDHPNIARIYDGGVTGGEPGGVSPGRPFFVMELVGGVPLTNYCDQKRLSVEARLQLFVSVCQAVQHAHQKGIIHRDLKPGNVLVTEVDGRPTPKVIDFGVAKATEQKLTDLSFSDVGAIVGTPAYMSPEQADPTSMDIDTRTDVYALGVILYELLVGSPPLEAKQFKRGAVLEMLRMVREVEPPKPSTKLSSADALPNIAANRGTEPAKLAKLLQGELDWVVMKAIEKDRTRRYDTANGLARDLQRHLADEVVEARPPSRGYRLRKFVKRNKIQVIAASLVFFALLAGITGTTLGLVESRRQEAEAKKQEGIARDEADAKEQARAVAVLARDQEARERRYAEAIARFVRDDFLALTSVEGQARFGGEGLTRDATLRDLLNRAAKKLKERKDLDPRTEAELNWIIGVSYRGAGDAPLAIPFLERSVQIRRQIFGRNDPSTLDAQNSLAVAYSAAGFEQKALPLYEETLALAKARLGADHEDTLAAMRNLASCYSELWKDDRAEPLIEETLKLMQARYGPDHEQTLLAMETRAKVYLHKGDSKRTASILDEALKLAKAKYGAEHPITLGVMNNLASAYGETGNFTAAITLLEEVLKIESARLEPDHPDTLTGMSNLAATYEAAGQLVQALDLKEEVLKRTKARHGDFHPDTIASMGNLGLGYSRRGNRLQGLPMLTEALRLAKIQLGPDHPRTLLCINNLAGAHMAANEVGAAIPLFEESRRLTDDRLGPDHPDTLRVTNNLGNAYRLAGKLGDALLLLEESLNRMKAKLGPDHPMTLVGMTNLSVAYAVAGREDLAIPLEEETLKRMKARLGPEHLETIRAMSNLGEGYRKALKLPQALDLLEEALKLAKANLGPEHPLTVSIMGTLARADADAGKYDRAIPLYELSLKLTKAQSGPDDPETLTLMNNFGWTYVNAGKFDLAQPLLEESLTRTRAKFGPHHPVSLARVDSLTFLYWRTKQFEKSIPLAEELLNRHEAKSGRRHPDTVMAAGNLGINYLSANRFRDAIPLLEEAYRGTSKDPRLAKDTMSFYGHLIECCTAVGEIGKAADLLLEHLPETRAALPKESPQLAGVLARIGHGLLAQKKWADAESLLRECLAIREKLEPDSWFTFNTKSQLGGALLSQKKYADAEPLLVAGYEGMKAREQSISQSGGAELRIPEALDRLIELSTATNKPDEVKKWRAERAKYEVTTPAEKK